MSKNEEVEIDLELEDSSFLSEPHAGLPEEPVVAVESHEARLFEIKGSVLKLSHRPGAQMDLSGVVLSGDPVVPIIDEVGNILGSAKLTQTEDEIVAEGNILYSCPERLSLEAGHKLHLHMNGHIEVSGGGNGRLAVGSTIKIQSLFLISGASSDPRIEPVSV